MGAVTLNAVRILNVTKFRAPNQAWWAEVEYLKADGRHAFTTFALDDEVKDERALRTEARAAIDNDLTR